MATIADLRTARTGFNDVADLFDDVNTRIDDLVTAENDSLSTLFTSSGTSAQNVTPANSLACLNGDKVLMIVSGSYSHSAVNGELNFRPRKDSTPEGFESRTKAFKTGTSGDDSCFCYSHVFSISANATYDFGLSVRVPSGTGYIIIRQITLLKLSI